MNDKKTFIENFKDWYPFIEKGVFLFVAIVGLIITIRLTPVFKSIDSLTNKVEALEIRDVKIENFIKEHTDQQKLENEQSIKNGVLLNLITDYFKLTPKEDK